MLGRPATRIDLKIEEDLQEYEEFKRDMISKLQKMKD